MEIDKNNVLVEITKKLKIIIIFIDYIFIITLISILTKSLTPILNIDTPWLFRFLIYLLYYTLMEFYFNKTLGMSFLGVSIKNKNHRKLDMLFLTYSVLVLFDRVIFLVIYIFQVLLCSDKKLLVSEKYSGFRWVKKGNVPNTPTTKK